ncbi:hypothetical protein [Treponema sp. OMZ 857]|uniref:hypothetical protein n=1 Tax=Treponema sp. OMZ 857 TaxID=1643513 RepID=UPI0020A457A5|nr:hypothetical protein [Treponema sp. OMZ 857]
MDIATKAKIVVAVVRVVVVPNTDDAVLRVVVPAAAAYDAVITGSSTLLMSLPFLVKIFEPLKRLLGAALTYFQNYTAPHNTFCRFGFAATGGLRNAVAAQQAKCEKGATNHESQDRRGC